MNPKECERIAQEIDKYDNLEKKFILFTLLGEYKKECLSYADNDKNSQDSRELARLTASRSSDIECLLAYDLW